MARQCGLLLFEGSVGNLTGYQVNGKHYLRQKGGVSRRRILYDRRFENTRRNAEYFAKAQKIASEIYLEIRRLGHRDQRKYWYPLRNRAQELVRKNLELKEIKLILRKEFVETIVQLQASSCKLQAQRQEVTGSQLDAQSSQLPPDEIFLGKQPNAGLIPGLVDQLAAGTALVKTLLKKKEGSSICDRERKPLEYVLRQFRR